MHDIDRHAIMSQNDIQHTSIKDEATLSQMVCRICSTEQQNDDSMNNLLTSDHNGLYFVDMLHDCLQRAIPRDNGFPLNICLDCTSKLIVVYNFRLMYNASQKKFTEMLGYSCKSEGLEPKVDVIIDESESDDVKPRFFFDWAAFDVPIAPPTTCGGINHISNCETGLKFEPHTEVKLNKPRVQRYECYQCKTMFKRITYLRKHMKNLHDTADKCWSDCHKRYSHRKQLVDHLNKHKTRQNCNDEKETLTSETPQSTFLCSECGKTFKNKWLLTSHQNVHSTEKQFVCSKCPSRFKWKLALTYHMTIHQRQDRQKHVCDTCGKSYATRSSMKAHAKIHSGVRPYACDKCSKQFLRREHLARHYRSHTGERPYVCKYCDRCFRQCGQLNTHLRVHIGEKIYQCDLCLHKFKLKSEMTKHECEHYENQDIRE